MTNGQLWTIGPIVAVALVFHTALLFYRAAARLFGIVIVPEDSVGIVNNKYVVFGQNRTLPAGSERLLHMAHSRRLQVTWQDQ